MSELSVAELRTQLKRMGITGVDKKPDQVVIDTAVQSMRAMVAAYLQVVEMAEAVSGQQVVPSEEIALLKTNATTGFTVDDRR